MMIELHTLEAAITRPATSSVGPRVQQIRDRAALLRRFADAAEIARDERRALTDLMLVMAVTTHVCRSLAHFSAVSPSHLSSAKRIWADPGTSRGQAARQGYTYPTIGPSPEGTQGMPADGDAALCVHVPAPPCLFRRPSGIRHPEDEDACLIGTAEPDGGGLRNLRRWRTTRTNRSNSNPSGSSRAPLRTHWQRCNLIFSRQSFDWQSVATVATLLMTLFIQRAEHRDTQAIHAKLDELLRAEGRARSELTQLDDQEPEVIEQHRSEERRSLG